MKTSRSWSTELEGIRGMASLWVLLGHITLLIDCHIKLISSPGIAVDLFILLSGYLMAKNYMERKKEEPWDSLTTMKSFWLRRFFRIAPLYYFLLGIALISGPWLGGIREFIAQYYPTSATAASRYADQSIFNIFTHVSFFFGFLPSYSYNTALPDWSIGLEMQFYLLFPFVMLAVLRLGCIRTLLILMLLCCISRFLLGGYFVSFIMPSMILIKLNMFISGMCLAEAIRRNLPSYVALALLSSVVSIITMLNIIRLQIIMDLLMISGMAILLWQYPENSNMQKFIRLPRKLLNNSFSTWLGDVSYSVYLLHLLIVIPVIGFLLRFCRLAAYTPFLRFSIASLVCLPLVYLLASILYHLIEKKGINMGKSLLHQKIKTEQQMSENNNL